MALPGPGPTFFIIDFTADKGRALALARRFRDLGAEVARDILSRGLDESLAYARGQRMRWALVIGAPEAGADAAPDTVRVVDLAGGREWTVTGAELLADPRRHFPGVRERAPCLT